MGNSVAVVTQKKTARKEKRGEFTENEHANLVHLKKKSTNMSNFSTWGKRNKDNMSNDNGSTDHFGSKLKKNNKLRNSFMTIMSGKELGSSQMGSSIDDDMLANTKTIVESMIAPRPSPKNSPMVQSDSNSIIFVISAHTLATATAGTLPNDGTLQTSSFGHKSPILRPFTPSPSPSPSCFLCMDSTTMAPTMEKKSWVITNLDECFVSAKMDDNDYYVGHLLETSTCP